MSNKFLKSNEMASVVAVDQLAGDSVAYAGAAVIENDGGAIVSILSASDSKSTLKKYEKAIVLSKKAPKIEYLAGAKTERPNRNFIGIETTPLLSESGEPISCKIILEFSSQLKDKAIYSTVYRLMDGADHLRYNEFAADIGEDLKPVVTQTVQSFLDDNGGPEKFVGADARASLRTFAEAQLKSHLMEFGLQFKDLQCELQNEATWRGKSDKVKKLSAELQDAQKQNEILKRERDEIEARSEQASELEKQRYAQELEHNRQKQQEVDIKQSELLAIVAKEQREMKEGKSNELTQLVREIRQQREEFIRYLESRKEPPESRNENNDGLRQLVREIREQRDEFLKHLESRESKNASAPDFVVVEKSTERRPDSEFNAKRAKKLFERAKAHLQLDNYDDALENLNEAIAADPELVEAYQLLGKVQEDKSNLTRKTKTLS